MRPKKTNAFIRSALNPSLYISLGAGTGLVLSVFDKSFLVIGLSIMFIAFPAWYIKLWLPSNSDPIEEGPTEEDYA